MAFPAPEPAFTTDVPQSASAGRTGAWVRWVALTVGLAFLLLAPFQLNLYWMRVLSIACMYATLAQGINLIAGFTGYPAFGNVVFFGVGAYSAAIIMVKAGGNFVQGMLAAVLVPLIMVLVLGPAFLRLRGHYFAIATIGLNELVKALVDNLVPLTGGGMGLSVPLPPWGPTKSTHIFYYLLLGTMVASVVVTAWFRRSRLGYACRAIRDDEVKAEGMGLRTTMMKTIAWAISAMFTGLIGAIYSYWFSYIDPSSAFDLLIAIKSFVIFLVGGAATVVGPIVAAFFVEYLSTILWSNVLNYHLGIFGLGIMLIALYMPAGIIQFVRERVNGVNSVWRKDVPAD